MPLKTFHYLARRSPWSQKYVLLVDSVRYFRQRRVHNLEWSSTGVVLAASEQYTSILWVTFKIFILNSWLGWECHWVYKVYWRGDVNSRKWIKKSRGNARRKILLEQAEAGIFRVCRHLPRPILLYLSALNHLFLFREDVLLPHADLKALLKAATFAESPIGLVHPTSLIIRTLEIILHR